MAFIYFSFFIVYIYILFLYDYTCGVTIKCPFFALLFAAIRHFVTQASTVVSMQMTRVVHQSLNFLLCSVDCLQVKCNNEIVNNKQIVFYYFFLEYLVYLIPWARKHRELFNMQIILQQWNSFHSHRWPDVSNYYVVIKWTTFTCHFTLPHYRLQLYYPHYHL